MSPPCSRRSEPVAPSACMCPTTPTSVAGSGLSRRARLSPRSSQPIAESGMSRPVQLLGLGPHDELGKILAQMLVVLVSFCELLPRRLAAADGAARPGTTSNELVVSGTDVWWSQHSVLRVSLHKPQRQLMGVDKAVLVAPAPSASSTSSCLTTEQ